MHWSIYVRRRTQLSCPRRPDDVNADTFQCQYFINRDDLLYDWTRIAIGRWVDSP